MPSLRTVEFDTYLSLVPETGTIEFVKHRSGITVAGPASFYRPVVSMLIHYTGDVLLSSFSGSPTEIEFRSELNPLGDSTYEYVHSVTNLTNNPITFGWSSTTRAKPR